MPVIAVVNRKGGSGKSTLAAHIAAWVARRGSAVMLGDVDSQQSARTWLKRRDPQLPAISPWAVDQKNMLRVPVGITHVVLDTPGGMHGFELARVVMFADAIIMPICNSIFDRESATDCQAELMALPRVANGRCRLVSVGMRIDGRTNAAQKLREWSEGLDIPFLGALRETQLYVKSLERGMTIFDLPSRIAAADVQQWQPLLDWLEPLMYPAQAVSAPLKPASVGRMLLPIQLPPQHAALPANKAIIKLPLPSASRVQSSLSNSLLPAQESLVHGERLSVYGAGRLTGAPVLFSGKPAMTRNNSSADGLHIPQFLKPVEN